MNTVTNVLICDRWSHSRYVSLFCSCPQARDERSLPELAAAAAHSAARRRLGRRRSTIAMAASLSSTINPAEAAPTRAISAPAPPQRRQLRGHAMCLNVRSTVAQLGRPAQRPIWVLALRQSRPAGVVPQAVDPARVGPHRRGAGQSIATAATTRCNRGKKNTVQSKHRRCTCHPRTGGCGSGGTFRLLRPSSDPRDDTLSFALIFLGFDDLSSN